MEGSASQVLEPNPQYGPELISSRPSRPQSAMSQRSVTGKEEEHQSPLEPPEIQDKPPSLSTAPRNLRLITTPGPVDEVESWISTLEAHKTDRSEVPLASSLHQESNLSRISHDISNSLHKIGQTRPEFGKTLDPTSVNSTLTRSLPKDQDNAPFRRASYVFTSSKHSQNLRNNNVIGVVASSGRSDTASGVFPNTHLHHPQQKTKPSRAALTPEQIRVHALGAVHALPASSLFSKARGGSSTTAILSLNHTQILASDEESRGSSNSRSRGAEFYMNAAKRARSGSGVSPVTPAFERPKLISRSSTDNRSVISLTSSGSNYNSKSGEKQSTNEAGNMINPSMLTPPVSPSPSRRSTLSSGDGTTSSRRGASRSSTSETLRQQYTRFLDDDPNRFSFISCQDRQDTASPYESSTSSGKSIRSLDESLSGLPAFGVIGSGDFAAVWGSANVMKPPSKRKQSDLVGKPNNSNPRPLISENSQSKV